MFLISSGWICNSCSYHNTKSTTDCRRCKTNNYIQQNELKSKKLSINKSLTKTIATNTIEQQISKDEKLCSICCDRIGNAAILHNDDSSTAHVGLCYVCALYLYENGKTCPACRVEISKIITIYQL